MFGVALLMALCAAGVLAGYLALPLILLPALGRISTTLTLILLLPAVFLVLIWLLRLSFGLPAISLGLPRALAEGWDISRFDIWRRAVRLAVGLPADRLGVEWLAGAAAGPAGLGGDLGAAGGRCGRGVVDRVGDRALLSRDATAAGIEAGCQAELEPRLQAGANHKLMPERSAPGPRWGQVPRSHHLVHAKFGGLGPQAPAGSRGRAPGLKAGDFHGLQDPRPRRRRQQARPPPRRPQRPPPRRRHHRPYPHRAPQPHHKRARRKRRPRHHRQPFRPPPGPPRPPHVPPAHLGRSAGRARPGRLLCR